MADTKWSQFPNATPGNSDEVVGLHSGDNARFSIANIVAAVRNGLANLFVPKSDVGAANGVASLDNTGKVPTSQLPSSTGPEPATATPLMDGTGAVGVSTKYAREDHEHPADTNKQNKITASGILKGDGQGGVTAATAGTDYQAPLTIDATPTANSTNPVQSGGVYTDVRTRVPNIGKGKNLFRNPWFRVNQRGVTSLNLPSTSGYTCDGWVIYRSSFVQNADNSVTITIGSSSYGFIQAVPLNQLIPGEKYTLSARGMTQTAYITFTMPSTSDYIGYLSSGIRIWVGVYADRYEFWFTQSSGFSFTLTRVKLELGEESTLDGDVEPDYEYELYRCITSTADSSDTYANKSLATEQQLAYVETGTTASQNYTAGQYISLNGLLYTADTAIASGATFYTSGGNKNLTECVGGGFNDHSTGTVGRGTMTSGTILSASLVRWSRVVVCTCQLYGLSGINRADCVPFRMPEGFRPTSDTNIQLVFNDGNNGKQWITYGTLKSDGYVSGTNAVLGSFAPNVTAIQIQSAVWLI